MDVTPTARLKVDAHVGRSWTADSTRIQDLSSTFGPNETVFAVVDIPGRVDGTLRVRWVYGGTETVGEQTVTLQQAFNTYSFRLTPPNGGHRAGQYTFEVYIDENRSDTETFTVTG